MDDRLKKALDVSNMAASINTQKSLAVKQLNDDLVYYTSGCKFTANIEFIASLYAIANSGQTSMIVLDDNNNPYTVTQVEEFANTLYEHNQTALLKYKARYDEVKNSRSLEKLIEV